MLKKSEIKKEAYNLFKLIKDYNSPEAFKILKATKKIYKEEILGKN